MNEPKTDNTKYLRTTVVKRMDGIEASNYHELERSKRSHKCKNRVLSTMKTMIRRVFHEPDHTPGTPISQPTKYHSLFCIGSY